MKLAFIKEQIEWVDSWTTNLISDLNEKDFGIVPTLGTSINWQVGHLTISKYFHSIQSVLQKDDQINKQINKQIPLDNFLKYYFAGSNPTSKWINRPDAKQLLEFMEIVDKATFLTLEKLMESNLEEKTEIGNPVAKTKYDALTFTFKHQMWHNGQIAMIKRIIR
ncbi:MAG: DinB family protein [Melioribacteraceae bacterium]